MTPTLVLLDRGLARHAKKIAARCRCLVVPKRTPNPTLVSHGLVASSRWHILTHAAPRTAVADLYVGTRAEALYIARQLATMLRDKAGQHIAVDLLDNTATPADLRAHPRELVKRTKAIRQCNPARTAPSRGDVNRRVADLLAAARTAFERGDKVHAQRLYERAWEVGVGGHVSTNPSRTKTARAKRTRLLAGTSRKSTRAARAGQFTKAGYYARRSAYRRGRSVARGGSVPAWENSRRANPKRRKGGGGALTMTEAQFRRVPLHLIRETTLGTTEIRAFDKRTGKIDWTPVTVKGRKRSRTANPKRRNPGARIVYNKLLAGWYVVTGPHQTPLNGRFNSKAEAQAWLARRANPAKRIVAGGSSGARHQGLNTREQALHAERGLRTLGLKTAGVEKRGKRWHVIVANPSRSKAARARRRSYRSAVGKGSRKIARAVASFQRTAKGSKARVGAMAKYRYYQHAQARRAKGPGYGRSANPSGRIAAYTERRSLDPMTGEDGVLRQEWRVVKLSPQAQNELHARHVTVRGVIGLEHRYIRRGTVEPWTLFDTFPNRRAALSDIPGEASTDSMELKRIQIRRSVAANEAARKLERDRLAEARRETTRRTTAGSNSAFERMLHGSERHAQLAQAWNDVVATLRALPKTEKAHLATVPEFKALHDAVIAASTVPAKAKAIAAFMKYGRAFVLRRPPQGFTSPRVRTAANPKRRKGGGGALTMTEAQFRRVPLHLIRETTLGTTEIRAFDKRTGKIDWTPVTVKGRKRPTRNPRGHDPALDEAVRRIRTGLKRRGGVAWSVTRGTGSVYGWIYIRSPRRDMNADERAHLSKLLGLTGLDIVHHQGVMVPPLERDDFTARAEGKLNGPRRSRNPRPKRRSNPAIHFDRRTLPDMGQRIVAAAFPSYKGNKFQLDYAESIHVENTWSGGSKEDTVFVRLDTLEVYRPPDTYRTGSLHAPIPDGSVAVQHVMFTGTDLGIRIVAPLSASRFFPAPAGDVTEDELIVLDATRSYKNTYAGKSNYRFHEAHSYTGITLERWEAAKASAIASGLLNKAGAITPAGRNAVGDFRVDRYRRTNSRAALSHPQVPGRASRRSGRAASRSRRTRNQARRIPRGSVRTSPRAPYRRKARPSATGMRRHPNPTAVDQAAKVVRMFQDRGPIPVRRRTVKKPKPLGAAAALIGKVVAVTYDSPKFDGKKRHYEHTFDEPQPLLVADPETQDLSIVRASSRYRLTPDGIVN